MKKLLLALWVIPLLLAFEARAQLSVGTLTTAGLNEPYNVVEDSSFNIYVSDSINNRIVMFDGNNQSQSTLAGSTGSPGATDGPYAFSQFNNPQGLLPVTIAGTNGLLVADTGNNLIRFVRLSDGYVTTLAGKAGVSSLTDNPVGTNATFTAPYGLTKDGNGHVYIVDLTASKIRMINLNDPNFGVSTVTIIGTTFSQPWAIAYMGTNQFWVADTGNHTIKMITLTTPTNGSLTTYMGGNNSHAPGTTDSAFGSSARFNHPSGLLWDPGLGLLISDTGNNTIRLATNNPAYGATNYSVFTYAGTPGSPGLVNGTASAAKFSSPLGLWQDPNTDVYYVADLGNNAIRSLQYGTIDYSPVSLPTIGYVTIVTDPLSLLQTAVFNTDEASTVFNNDPNIKISDPAGTTIFYTLGSTPSSIAAPVQTQTSNSVDAYVVDGIPGNAGSSMIPSQLIRSNLTIEAIGALPGSRRPPSAIAYGQFTFKTGTPYNSNATNINDPQNIFLASKTTNNATIYYTKDGGNPTTNTSLSVLNNQKVPVTDADFNTNGTMILTAFARRSGYADSSLFTETFYKTNSQYDVTISFGFASGEATSAFVASPGQTFYAPVTLTLAANAPIYSMQFNLAVTNGGPNPGPQVAPNAYSFSSLLQKPIPSNPALYETIPPLAFIGDAANPPPANQIVSYDGATGPTNFVNLLTYHTSLNLIGVGWLARRGENNLYDTLSQTLITFSQAHDITYLAPNGRVIVGSYTFQVPLTAALNTTYKIQIGSATATSDGIGGPGAAVDVHAADNGSLTNGAINATKFVTVGQRKYLAGDAYPFLWFNAGDFGDGSLVNADVEQVFEAAVYSLNAPPAGSDFFDCMDSCGNIGFTNGSGVYTNAGAYSPYYPATNYLSFSNLATVYGYSNIVDVVTNTTNTFVYYTNVTPTLVNFTYLDPNSGQSVYTTNATDIFFTYTNTITTSNGVVIASANTATNYSYTLLRLVQLAVYNYNLNNLFDGNDTTINTVAFGDGQLDVCDVYVTFRRSLDPSLKWFQRYWSTTGVRVAQTVPNTLAPIMHSTLPASSPLALRSAVQSSSAVPPQVAFAAGAIQGAAGQVVQVPITATIFGSYPLRVLMLSLTVVPLDGSPALTTPVQFSNVAPALGAPSLTGSQGNGNYSATWLNSTIAGLTGTATLGTLTVTLPAGATASAAYAVHFDHASASPNGLASFPKQTLTGLVTLSARTNSSYGDGIPDSWRLRWFGTVNNLLSVSNACPSGDGISNYKKYVAGVDPSVASNFPTTNPVRPAPPGSTMAIHWPTVLNKQYVIERSSSLFSGPWTTISTNTGTGADMEYDDQTAGAANFYRVRILP